MQKLNAKKQSFLLLAAVVLLASWSNKASAQTGNTATLTITLQAVQTIAVNDVNKAVAITYGSAANYNTGVNSGVLADHLQMFSNDKFAVYAAASGALTNGSSTIPINTVTLVASAGTTNTQSATITYSPVVLSTTATKLISSGSGTSATFSVNYETSGGASYFNGLTTGTYTATITYTILPS